MKTKKKNYIATWTGKKFDLLDPNPKDVDIRDIARALSRIARFTGHTRDFLSVGQHCYHVYLLLKEWGAPVRVQLAGLLHDAPEAYLNDVVRPLKKFLPFYKGLELSVHRAVVKGLKLHDVLRLSEAEEKMVKAADDTLALTEKRDQITNPSYMPAKDFSSAPKPWARRIRGMEWREAEKLFLRTYTKLIGQL